MTLPCAGYLGCVLREPAQSTASAHISLWQQRALVMIIKTLRKTLTFLFV